MSLTGHLNPTGVFFKGTFGKLNSKSIEGTVRKMNSKIKMELNYEII